MKATKRILATIVGLCLILGCLFTTAFAEEQNGGTITIQNQSGTNATVAGKTFKLFKIFSATTSSDGKNISYNWCKDANQKTFQAFFESDAYGYCYLEEGSNINDVVEKISSVMQSESYELSQFASALHKYVHDTGIVETAKLDAPTDATAVTFDNLGLGYYMVYDATEFSDEEETAAVRSAAMLTTNKQNVTISLKANRPSVKKEVLENDGVTYGKGTSSNIGEVVSFKITTHIPSHKHYGSTYNFYIEDKMADGLTLKPETIEVYRTNTAGTQDELLHKDTYYKLTLPTDESADFKIDFSDFLGDQNTEYGANDEIYITYKATITNEIKPKAANANVAKLTYSNDPNKADSIGSSTDEAYVYSYQFVFTKFAQDSSGNYLNKRLAGAEFQLYRVNANGSDTLIKFTTKQIDATQDLNAYTQYIVADSTQQDTTDTLVVHSNGEETTTISGNNFGGHLGDISIFGLAEGTYKLVETKAPDGYVLPNAPFIIKISDQIDNYGTVGVLEVTTEHEGTGKVVNARGVAEGVLTVWAEITNKPGAMLPETGGMGTTLFTVIGIILMAGALGFFSTRKRNSMV